MLLLSLPWSLTLSGSEAPKGAEERALVGAAQAENNWHSEMWEQGGDRAQIPTAVTDGVKF